MDICSNFKASAACKYRFDMVLRKYVSVLIVKNIHDIRKTVETRVDLRLTVIVSVRVSGTLFNSVSQSRSVSETWSRKENERKKSEENNLYIAKSTGPCVFI